MREYHFTEQDFQNIRKLIYQHAGISLGEQKQELVYSRLARRLRATGTASFAEYLERLQRGDEAEWEAFTNSLTTNLTSFFREEHHFPLLANHLRKIGKARPVVLWCSASSTGEEAYSMAMTVADAFGGFDHQVRIIASDLDTKVLETARIGRYKQELLSKLSPQQIEKYFLRGTGSDAGFMQVRPELQRMISFKRINLLDSRWPINEQLDVIFCRNVMIYFDKDTQLSILRKFAPLLRSDGLLFAGHSESFHHASALFKLRSSTVYELAKHSPAPENKIEPLPGNAVAIPPVTVATARIHRIIVVGSSTGGTEALKVFLTGMPTHAPPILIAQHMPELFTDSFASRLSGLCRMRVKVAEHHDVIQPGWIYLAPGHSHLLLERSGTGYCTSLSKDPPVNRHRPSVEVLFHSAAKLLGNKAVGVMLTGMGKDGAEAMLEMHRAGAYNFAQDEASCVVFGMPREAIELGAVDEVVPLAKMSERVLAHLKVT